MTNQMELSFDRNRNCRSLNRRPLTKSTRASWWFAKMRQVVNQATDFKPTPPARPEQIWFPE
jgi:hypothetical protein